jgi:hypothetical protein
VIRILLFFAVATLPLYAFESGGLQISHAFFAAAAVLYLARNGVSLIGAEVLLAMLGVYVLLRQVAWTMAGGGVGDLLPFLYIVFNALVFNVVRRWYVDDRRVAWLRNALLVALCIAVAGVLVKGYGFTIDSEGQRAVGTFNNPNQLGYFAVCAFSTSALFYLRGQSGLQWLMVFFIGTAFLAVASLSKAAMISIALCGLMVGYSLTRSKLAFMLGTVIAATLIGAGVLAMQHGYLDDFKFVARLRGLGTQGDDSLTVRGYGVLSDASALQLIFGFSVDGVRGVLGHEVHSTLFSYFASFGVVGGLLFLAFHVLWLLRLSRADGRFAMFVVALSPVLYGITHNGSRFTIYWMLLALCFAAPAKRTSNVAGDAGGFAVSRSRVSWG